MNLLQLLQHALALTPLSKGPREPGPYISNTNDILRGLSENFNKPLMNTSSFLMLFGILLLVLALYWLHRWRNTHEDRGEPVVVFHEVARQFGIDLRTQWLLVRVARHSGLSNPLTLILCDRTLRHHAQGYLRTLAGRAQQQAAQRLLALEKDLFRGT